ncbi:ABC transporter permease [Alkalihalobacillus sp. 1P02AB]|uniref:ABC transporter permease n=1 Tax=Alkalihalobacillus sp. 1P02AB TaxID=3132260 RepID=UPI0039A417F8
MILNVYKKEMLDMLRDRKTILLSVLLPIIFNLLVMFFMTNFLFNDNVDQINVAITEADSTLIASWVNEIEGANLIPSEDPSAVFLEGDAHIALIFDNQFEQMLASGETPMIQLQYDPASTRSSSAMDQIYNVLAEQMHGIVASNLAELNLDHQVIEPFYLVPLTASEENNETSLFILTIFAQLIIILSINMGGLSAANDLVAGEKERKTMEALLMTPVHRLHLVLGKWLTIATLCTISGFFSVATFFLYIYFVGGELGEALQIGENIGMLSLSLAVGILSFALLMASIYLMISLFSNTIKEASNYISPISFLTMIPYFLLIGVSVNELSTNYFIIPVMNIFALIKELIYGVYDITHILLVAGSSAIFVSILFLIAYKMFMKSKYVLGKAS